MGKERNWSWGEMGTGSGKCKERQKKKLQEETSSQTVALSIGKTGKGERLRVAVEGIVIEKNWEKGEGP